MRKGIKIVLLVAMVISLMATITLAATIVGTVEDNYQIITEDGDAYNIADTDTGNDLVMNSTGKIVRVNGQITEEEGVKTISIESFEIVE